MKLLIDFGSIKTGGGAQLAINFLDWLQNEQDFELTDSVCVILPENGPLAQFKSDGSKISIKITYPNNYIARKFFEITVLPGFIKSNGITHVFTFFGAGLPKFSGVKSLVSVAYPIICYPESPFWFFFPMKDKLKQRLLNYFRCNRIRSADRVLVETEVMKNRLEKYVQVNRDKLVVFPPVPSVYVEDKEYFAPHDNQRINLLFLSGLDNHKNLWRLPELAVEFVLLGFTSFSFILTVDKSQYIEKYSKYVEGKYHLLDEYFCFMGQVPSREINNLYSKSNFLVNLSDLESFSNNYMEAWKAGVPLICSKTDFSINICKESAVYVDPHNPRESAIIINDLLNNIEKQKTMTTYGKVYLNELPSISQRIQFIYDQLKEL